MTKKFLILIFILLSTISLSWAISIEESLKYLEKDPLSANNFKQYSVTSTRYIYKSAEGDCAGNKLHEEKISNVLECEKWCNDVTACSGYAIKSLSGGVQCQLKSSMGLDVSNNKIQNCQFIKLAESNGWNYFAANKNPRAITLDTPDKKQRPKFWGIATH